METEEIASAHQYLTFILDGEVYALEINQVREVLDVTEITRIPRMPEFMRGVINLRGCGVPVVDLRLMFGMPITNETLETCIVIMEMTIDGETTLIGAMADSVKEVLTLDPDKIQPGPKLGTRLKSEFIQGIGKNKADFIIILNMEKVFISEGMATMCIDERATQTEAV